MDKNIYRIIKPYQSMKVYEAKTTMHGAGKCYRELKKTNTKCDSFSIMNITDNSIYDFKVSPSKVEEMILKKDPSELLLNNNQIGGAELEKLTIQFKTELNNLSQRIKILENKIN